MLLVIVWVAGVLLGEVTFRSLPRRTRIVMSTGGVVLLVGAQGLVENYFDSDQHGPENILDVAFLATVSTCPSSKPFARSGR